MRSYITSLPFPPSSHPPFLFFFFFSSSLSHPSFAVAGLEARTNGPPVISCRSRDSGRTNPVEIPGLGLTLGISHRAMCRLLVAAALVAAALCDSASTCEDHHGDCRYWAHKGECEKNPASMLSLCPQSCGTCQELEKFSNAKDEI